MHFVKLYKTERGFCLRGDQCPYDHGADRIVVDEMLRNGQMPPMAPGQLPPMMMMGARPPFMPPGMDPFGKRKESEKKYTPAHLFFNKK